MGKIQIVALWLEGKQLKFPFFLLEVGNLD
jgi:hypothetical protein